MIHKIEDPRGPVLIIRTPMGWCGALWGPVGLGRVILPEGTRRNVRQKLGLDVAEVPLSLEKQAASAKKEDAWRLKAAKGLACLEKELQDYFAGCLVDFSASVDTSGMGSFKKEVYAVVRGIPYGEVRTYRWVARKAGSPGAARAVGGAMSRNPCPLVVPCHRVIRSDGGLGGFSAPGGIGLKRRLLELEGVKT